jgi:uncharacterized protein
MARRCRKTHGCTCKPHRSRATGKGHAAGRSAAVPELGWCDRWPSRSFVAKRLLSKMKGIADTGFIVAFANRNDRYHEWATEIAKRVTLSEPLLTCEAALAEAAFHLSSVPYALSLVSRGLLSIGFDLAENLEQVATLASKYQDRKPDLADLCIVRMSELFPRHVIITIDEGDFSVYRKNKRDVIPLLCPPKEYRPH